MSHPELTSIPSGVDDLTPEWFAAVIDAPVSACEVAPHGSGQWGMVLRATLEYDSPRAGAPDSVVVKLPSADEGSRNLGMAMGAYEAEYRFYTELAPRLPVSVPQLHHAEMDAHSGAFVLVMEDLSVDWRVGDDIARGSLAQAVGAIEQIVAFQAPLWDEPSLRDLPWLANPARTQMFFDFTAPALPQFVERFGPRLDPGHVALARRIAPNASSFPQRAWHGPMCLVHGDFRLDNLMFAMDRRPPVKVIDWQGLRLGPPLIDLGIYLATSLTTEDRRAHRDELLTVYYDGLVAAGVRDFSFGDCVESLRQCSLYTFLISVGASVTIQQTDRGDAMFASMITTSAELVEELAAASFLG